MEKIKVYGADWCYTTRRTLAHLEQTGVSYDYINVDYNPEASEWVKSRNNGKEIKPTIDIAGTVLSAPSNDELDRALAQVQNNQS